jgi:lauroyl/myristoyl acyltransferase
VDVEYIFLYLTNKIPQKQIYYGIFQANTMVSFLSNSLHTKVCIIKYFFNLNFYQQFIHKFFFVEKNLIRLTNWIYPTFFNLNLIDETLRKNKGLIILNLHSFNHFALQILLQRKYSNIYTIIMDQHVDSYLNYSKANTNNYFLHYKDKNLFFKLRNALLNNNIVIIHQDLFNNGIKYVNVNFMGKKICLLENIASYLSFYTSCPIITSFTHSICGVLTKINLSPFIESSKNNINIKEYIHTFHQDTANYIESFVRKYPSQWMGWKYLKLSNFKIENAKMCFFPDYIFFDNKQNCFIMCKIYPLYIIKLKPSKMHVNLIKFYYQSLIYGIKNYHKKS